MDERQAGTGLDGVEQVAPGPVEQQAPLLRAGHQGAAGQEPSPDQPGRDLVGIDLQ